ncbi:hypothetical protein NQZ68_015566 [Dissostichus eleginoides]|uniref:SCF E3 ubiquitin ligase complex F-box protein grrA n=1 Tax=Dissostichus eleginoides TaxID=100907 RepID=A0AAD9C3F6_DISEL|nr:hypothetical protein NQZ68_015566 [Dissostichus eleginoides]KAK1894058.1 SCF E3 ubiquitin ligase complex F-box protein grrA [Dissostichus eleginoides]
MSDSEWMSRLRKFASTGAWPAGEGNRPAPRQKKWCELYQRNLVKPTELWDSRVLHLVRSTELRGSRVLHLVRSTELWDSRLLHLVRSTELRGSRLLHLVQSTEPWDSRVLHLVRSTELWGSRVQQVLSKALWDTSRLQQKDTCEHH